MIEIEAKWSKSATVDVRAALAQPMAIGVATARHIKARILRGQTATRPSAFDRSPSAGPRKRKRYYISPAYAHELGLGAQTRWKSSAAMHAAKGIKAGTANATGGMWKGLQVRNYGRGSVIIEFARSSLGASSTRTAIKKKVHGTYEVTLSSNGRVRAKQAREFSRDEGGNIKYRRKAKKVLNRVKAAAVFRHSNIGLLQPTRGETEAQLAAVADAAAGVVVRAFGGKIEVQRSTGNRRLFAAIKKEMI